MAKKDDKAAKAAAMSEYRNARAALNRLSDRDKRRGVHEETPAYLRANRRVLDAEKNVPFWRR
jgi:hypothetical protein